VVPVAPVAPVAAASPTPAGDAQVSVPRSSAGEPWASVSLAFALMPHTYAMTSSGGADVPADARFTNGPFTGGLELRALAWPNDGSFGVEARGKGFFDLLTVGEQRYTSMGTRFHAGGRYRGEMSGDMHWFAGLGVEGISAIVFRYSTEAEGGLQLLRVPLYGARVGGGITKSTDRLNVDLGLFETFAPYPVDTAVSAVVDYPLSDVLAFRGSLDLNLLLMKFTVGSEPVNVTDIEYGLNAGLAYLFH
jgi:hypothetical protein